MLKKNINKINTKKDVPRCFDRKEWGFFLFYFFIGKFFLEKRTHAESIQERKALRKHSKTVKVLKTKQKQKKQVFTERKRNFYM